MSDSIRFIMLGGFLGAGKTTTIAQLAALYQASGKHVCIVTNDQAADLVDTHLLKSYGYAVAEVAGSCFCCNFGGLTQAIDSFSAQRRPDVVIAEPVGSCTDLVATVALPMMRMLGEEFVISPYAVIMKPSHGLKILQGTGKGFSPKAEYIFRKQLEEADILLINRIDELSTSQIDEIEGLLAQQYPDRPILRISARTGVNLDKLKNLLEVEAPRRTSIMDVDYDIYAEGEAELGWLNAGAQIRTPKPFSMDAMLVELVEHMKNRMLQLGAETAHLKVIGQSDGNTAVVNLVSSESPTTLSLASDHTTANCEVIINARVAVDPDSLKNSVEQVLAVLANKLHGTASLNSIRSFRPGRPVPTHRVAEV